MSNDDGIRVVELFAGVGGFRIGLEGPPRSVRSSPFRVVWANQWEPSTKTQHAAQVYAKRWEMVPTDDPLVFSDGRGDLLVNKDIASIDASEIPDHDLLCGGFPCQDYSVAKTLSSAQGIGGKKGVLWWEIRRIIAEKKPNMVMLENVDRLLKSPASQRGRDFAVMLASLDDLGYAVEWRVIDASEYGFPQRRKRVFVMAYSGVSAPYSSLSSTAANKWLDEGGPIARAFPVDSIYTISLPYFDLRAPGDGLADISEGFNSEPNSPSPFANSGVMVSGRVWTSRTTARYSGPSQTLARVLVKPSEVGEEFVLDPESLTRERGWVYHKGAKREERTGTEGFTYKYSEGPVTFPDALDRPSRTIVTGEGGASPSRFKHVVTFEPTEEQNAALELSGREASKVRMSLRLPPSTWLRRLTPVELERLNGFPDGHTSGPSDGRRAFLMGNALVCGIPQILGDYLHSSNLCVET